MSIVKLKKVTLFGVLKNKDAILNGLQELGCMHLVPLRPPPREVEKIVSPRAEAAYKALRFLSDCPEKRRQVLRDASFDVDRFVAQVTELKDKLRHAADMRDFLKQRVADLRPWGDITFPPQESLADYRLWFYILPLNRRHELGHLNLPWQIVHRDHRHVYVVLIAKEEPDSTLLSVPRTHVGALPLSEVEVRLEEAEVELEALEAERQAFTRYIYLLNLNIADADNRAALAHAVQQTRDQDSIVAVQGWVPEAALPALREFCENECLALLEEKPTHDDQPPTLIEQPDTMTAGADLTLFYQVPGYRSWDPSRLLFASFSLFFAMILADAGYGLVLLAGLLFFWRRMDKDARLRSYRRLATSLFLCTIAYGALVGSYFGLTPASDSLLGRLHILDINDFDTMMRLSIIVGVIHVGFANAMVAYLNRHRPQALARLGWNFGIVGALILWLAPVGSVWIAAAQTLLAVAVVLIVLFSSERKAKGLRNHVLRVLEGLFSLRNVINAFGDILSYMRLFALGLASASLAITFNGLANDAYQSVRGGGLLIAILILAIGHALNLLLALISGVVHGLRLNFIEFYNWGQPEEGKAFKAFARKEVKP